MAVCIRLRRMGKRNAPAHRIVVADQRSPRDGRFIEILGTYNPRAKEESIDLARAEYWISQGAQPSDTVSGIIKRAKAGQPLGATVKKVEKSKPAAAEAAEDVAEAAAEAAADVAEAAPEEAAAEAPETDTDENTEAESK
jgi:small subunit ribosomal protein S16